VVILMWNDYTSRICYSVRDEDRLLDYWKTVLGVTDESAIIPPTVKKHLFIDIDDVLVTRHFRGEESNSFIVPGYYENIRLAPRPYIREFLRGLEPYYHLYAFTAATKTYAHYVLRNLPNTHLLKNVFTRADCEYQRNAPIKMPRRVMLWRDGMPRWTREHEVANSLLFDNDPFNAEQAYRDNVVTAKVFKDLKNDDYLLRVLGLLKALAVQDNIQVSLRAWKEDWMAKGIIRKA
ncbi:hypothetical protein HK405_000392, partial [Cladochytrium tenue]